MEKLDTHKLPLIATQRQKYRIPKLYSIPMFDCLLLLSLLLIIASKSFAPVRAIPTYFEPAAKPGPHYALGKAFVIIDNPTDGNELGEMYLRVGSMPSKNGIMGYDEMLSCLFSLPPEHKSMLLINAKREVFHEQIVRVLSIGEAAGIGKIGFGRVGFPVIKKRRAQ